MPDIPENYTDPRQIEKQRQAAAASPLYWCHPEITVHEYKSSSRARQDQVNAECRAIERSRREV